MKFVDLLAQKIRAADTFGVYKSISDSDLIMKYFKKVIVGFEETFEDISEDKIYKIKPFFETIACWAERTLSVQVNSCADISKEGFGKVIIYSGGNILYISHLRNLQSFGFKSPEEIERYVDSIMSEIFTGSADYSV